MKAFRLFTVRSTGKFIGYAAGEILLVVIGILLAMKINDWNEQRKEHAKEKVFLKALTVETENNLAQLQSVLFYNTKSKDAAYRLLQIYNDGYEQVDKLMIDSLLAQVQWIWTFDPDLSVLKSIKANANIETIQNPAIQQYVNSFEETVKDAEEESQVLKSIIVDHYVYSVSKFISLNLRVKHMGMPWGAGKSKFSSDYKGLFNDREIESLLTYIHLWRVSERDELELIRNNLLQNLSILKAEMDGK